MSRGKITSRRIQWMLTVAAVAGVLLGAHFTRQQEQALSNIFMQQMLNGTWELRTLKDAPLGGPPSNAIVSQRMTLREGRVEGVTTLRMGTEAATTAMPFPDASVRRVETSSDGLQVVVHWDGVYELKESRFLELTIGKARYRANLKFDADQTKLELDHDTILIYPGTAVYQPAASLIANNPHPQP